jgi:AmpD protein
MSSEAVTVPAPDPEAGWLPGAVRLPSPNCDERPAGEIRSPRRHPRDQPAAGRVRRTGIVDLFTNRLDPDAHPYFREIHSLARVRAFPDSPRRRS